tara:strand:- start:193 stop:390 length:198 start_codon:yes stop_codon:yes gene_type:complete
MKFGSIGYNVSTFLIIVLLMSYTMLMTLFINQQRGVEVSTMLILYFNIVFICVLVQMHVSSRFEI